MGFTAGFLRGFLLTEALVGNVGLLLACAIETSAHGQPVSIALGSMMEELRDSRMRVHPMDSTPT